MEVQVEKLVTPVNLSGAEDSPSGSAVQDQLHPETPGMKSRASGRLMFFMTFPRHPGTADRQFLRLSAMLR
jgi:hypothetical protein